MNHKTQELLRQARQGDRAALDALYRRYAPRVLAMVRANLGPKLRSKMESWDVAQSVLAASLESLDQFECRSEGALAHWLSQLVMNKIRDKADFYSAAKRDANKETQMDEQGEGATSLMAEDWPSQVVELSDDLIRLESALDQLSRDHRQIIMCVKYAGMTLREAGEELGRTEEAARKLLARALAKLSEILADDQT